jgi:hypothetical protein
MLRVAPDTGLQDTSGESDTNHIFGMNNGFDLQDAVAIELSPEQRCLSRLETCRCRAAAIEKEKLTCRYRDSFQTNVLNFTALTA